MSREAILVCVPTTIVNAKVVLINVRFQAIGVADRLVQQWLRIVVCLITGDYWC